MNAYVKGSVKLRAVLRLPKNIDLIYSVIPHLLYFSFHQLNKHDQQILSLSTKTVDANTE